MSSGGRKVDQLHSKRLVGESKSRREYNGQEEKFDYQVRKNWRIR